MELLRMIGNGIWIVLTSLFGLARDLTFATGRTTRSLYRAYVRRRTSQFLEVTPHEALFVVATLKISLGHKYLYRRGDTWFLGLPRRKWDKLLVRMQRLTFASEPMTAFDERIRAVLEKKPTDAPASPALSIAAG